VAARTDPFEAWRAQQHAPEPEPAETPELITVQLSPLRQAHVTAAWCEWRLARLRGEDGKHEWDRYDTVLEQQTCIQAVEDHGLFPDTIEGCQAILGAAAEIIQILADTGFRP
jgi:hypothetical protein